MSILSAFFIQFGWNLVWEISIMMYIMWECGENQHSKDCFLYGHKWSYMYACTVKRMTLESKDCFDKVCAVCHAVQFTVLLCCNWWTEPQCGVTGRRSLQMFLMLHLAIAHCGVPVTGAHNFTSALGYRGKNCEENIDDCPGNLCQNGATCVDDINRYSCLCPPTYMGELCEQDVDECGQRPSVCQNGATCTNSIGGFSCICVNGWAGPDCSVNIDDCAGAACFNGATCIDRVGSFYCRCTPGKTGMSNVCSTHKLFRFHQMQGVCWPDEEVLVCQKYCASWSEL